MTYAEALLAAMRSDERIVVLTAENWSPVVPIGLSGINRFIDTGINEQTLVGIAAGLAANGRIPFVHAIASFLTMRAFEFIRTDIGFPRLPVRLIGTLPGFLSEGNGPTHQSIEDLALMRTIPGMRVFAPATQHEIVLTLPRLLASPDPWYIRFPADPGTQREPAVVEGRAVLIGGGSDVYIVTAGTMVAHAAAAARLLQARGVATSVLDLRFIQPLDRVAIEQIAKKGRLIIAVEDHLASGGIGELVASTLFGMGSPPKLVRLSLTDYFPAAPLPLVLAEVQMDAESICRIAMDALSR